MNVVTLDHPREKSWDNWSPRAPDAVNKNALVLPAPKLIAI